MNHVWSRGVAVVCVAVGLVGSGLAAGTNAAVELSALLSRQVELSMSVYEQQRQLDAGANDASLTSPEIASLRRQLEGMRLALGAAEGEAQAAAVRREMVCTQEVLRVTLQALPAMRARIDQIDADRRTLQEAGRRIQELRAGAIK